MVSLVPHRESAFARSPDESEAPDRWRGLVAAWLPFLGQTGAIVRDYSGKALHASGPLDAWAVTQRGEAYPTTGATLTSSTIAPWHSLAGGSESSIVMVGEWPSVPGADGVNINVSDHRLFLEAGAGTLVTRTAGSSLFSSITLSAGDRFVAISAWRVGTSHSIWLNGRDAGTLSTGDTSTSGVATLNAPGTWKMAGGFVYSRYIGLEEARDWYRDPYAMVRLRRRVIGRAPVVVSNAMPMAMNHYRRRRTA